MKDRALAVVSWPSNMNVSTSARMSLSDRPSWFSSCNAARRGELQLSHFYLETIEGTHLTVSCTTVHHVSSLKYALVSSQILCAIFSSPAQHVQLLCYCESLRN